MRSKLCQGIRVIRSVATGSCLGALGAWLYGVLFVSVYALIGYGSGRASHLTLSWFAFSGALAGGIVAVVRAIDRALGWPEVPARSGDHVDGSSMRVSSPSRTAQFNAQEVEAMSNELKTGDRVRVITLQPVSGYPSGCRGIVRSGPATDKSGKIYYVVILDKDGTNDSLFFADEIELVSDHAAVHRGREKESNQ